MSLDQLLSLRPHSIRQGEKEAMLVPELNALTGRHRDRCPAYDRLLAVTRPNYWRASCLAEVPYLPVGLYKTHRLVSVADDEIAVTLASSGTTGQQVSRIYLDRETAQRQTFALAHTFSHILGSQRLPMIVIDTRAVLQDRRQFSARTVGVLGMMNFGRQHFFALDQEMNLDLEGLKSFLAKHESRPFLLFGFTFMVWQYFYRPLAEAGIDLSQGILVHSGGWKKLQEQSVSNEDFKCSLKQATGIERIYNFYGMVEQVGGVSLEGEDGYLYPSHFSDVIIRDPYTWKEAPIGRPGVIQVLSILPLSYPGHSLLSEDLGVLHGIDDSSCGRLGKRFSVFGRAPRAELRGCSDTHVYSREGNA